MKFKKKFAGTHCWWPLSLLLVNQIVMRENICQWIAHAVTKPNLMFKWTSLTTCPQLWSFPENLFFMFFFFFEWHPLMAFFVSYTFSRSTSITYVTNFSSISYCSNSELFWVTYWNKSYIKSSVKIYFR